MSAAGVSFVVPVHNGARWLDEVLRAIAGERDGRPFEVIAVDDGSTDKSATILEAWEAREGTRVIRTAAGSHPAALNAGIQAARHTVVCLVDQDVVVQRGWLSAIDEAMSDPRVAAAQGTYLARPSAPILARVMGMDVEERYAAMEGRQIEHVCTGNSAYRLDALQQVGLFDESFGYGADNDMSYRLAEAGYQLRFCPGARSVHHWKETLRAYLLQQYGLGYGRLDLVAKHPKRVAGDSVSPAAMMAHAPLMLAALAAAAVALCSLVLGGPAVEAASITVTLTGLLALERTVAGVRAAFRRRDAAGLFFPPVHLLRDVAWAVAIVVWAARRVTGRRRVPPHSMPRGAR